ncbi:nucleolar complex-associated protein 3 [Laetiporus sulphureus 93-53]|uniref:Nucleolar complex-associated protein 3 n=1 Tax=Laetiporus sulphureus 93-53 TaxID=1314785 RepID=A0A165H887_9APHY|nr:nucleolar complex-associated protein 3 [Laetiporus sulphureus 93-53]KZT11382.1 nucleolar complex-associated protein 3 [Laetiporus sulphureus 93-53]
MAISLGRKRAAQPSQRAAKKRKLGKDADLGKKVSSKVKSKGKERAADRETIPIPANEDDVELSEDDLDMLEEYGSAVAFLSTLDEKGIARSKKETERLHNMHKPIRGPVEDDLPSVDSHDEDEDSWSSGISEDEDVGLSGSEDEGDEPSSSSSPRRRQKQKQKTDSDEEMSYEMLPRKRRSSWEPESDKLEGIERLPIKLADGRIQKSTSRVLLTKGEESAESDEEDATGGVFKIEQTYKVEDVSTGARFGRPAVVDVIGNKSRKARIQGAKEQIAGICQDIISDPENSLGLLRRLHTFSLPEISTSTHPEPVPNDAVIRKLTILSQLAVFKDIIPGYRIRALTDKEKAEKVSQIVQRTRDWEQGLVSVYQAYLRILEGELKAKSELAETALHSMCSLLAEVMHFNFRVNLMTCVVAYLSRKSWNQSSDLCLNTIIKVFRADSTGEASLEVVRLLNRMVKERRFNVHPEVLSSLLHLRLKTELGVRSSESKADKEQQGRIQGKRKGKGKKVEQPHLSQKMKKALKERKEIQKEMREAEAEVDKEERAATQTETLKLLFVLYFRILKNPDPTPLLPAALEGISKYSHLVNIDFFKDLMQVLKNIMAREPVEGSEHGRSDQLIDMSTAQHQLLCIVTAFELLSGQGEALDIDLTDVINRLYAILPSLSLVPDIETIPTAAFKSEIRTVRPQTVADMLFRALHLVFIPRASSSAAPPWRAAAFSKRLLTAALQWPPATACRALDFVGTLVERDPKLEALLSTEDRSGNGVYRPDLDDPQLSNPFGTTFWELYLLEHKHWDARVRDHARKVLHITSA